MHGMYGLTVDDVIAISTFRAYLHFVALLLLLVHLKYTIKGYIKGMLD